MVNSSPARQPDGLYHESDFVHVGGVHDFLRPVPAGALLADDQVAHGIRIYFVPIGLRLLFDELAHFLFKTCDTPELRQFSQQFLVSLTLPPSYFYRFFILFLLLYHSPGF